MICWVLAMGMLQGVWKQHLRPRAVVGYGVKIFLPSPPNYVIRSPGVNSLLCHAIIIIPSYSKNDNLHSFSFSDPRCSTSPMSTLQPTNTISLHTTNSQSDSVLISPTPVTQQLHCSGMSLISVKQYKSLSKPPWQLMQRCVLIASFQLGCLYCRVISTALSSHKLHKS